MGNDIYKNTIDYLPMFFDVPLQLDVNGASIFEPLRKIIDFDQGYIFFLNPDSIKLKYMFGKDRKLTIGEEYQINSNVKGELFSTLTLALDKQNELIKLLKIETAKSFIVLKLIIREAVFGFVLLCKDVDNFYSPESINIAPAISSIISYKIKDIELSDVFNSQIKSLANNVIETKVAERVKTEFLANMSHELRTPLNSIIGFSEILSNGFYGELNDKQKEFVQDINISGIRLLGMINEILDASKIEAQAMKLNKSDFSSTLATAEVINILKPLADKKKIKIITQIEEGSIYADAQKIKQILCNLMSNAIKFSPEKDEINIKLSLSNNNFIIEIKDNGIGIAPKDQEKIFEKFVQLENAYTKKESSTGLGLTITKEFVEMHNGKINVESDIGKGAKFIVTIPLKK